MYLRTLCYSGVKRLEDRDKRPLSFLREDGSVRKWTMLLGENGTCKTTLLQLIALAAVGYRRSDQLAQRKVTSFQDTRRKSVLTIDAEFEFSAAHHPHRSYPGLTSRPASPPRLLSELKLAPGKSLWRGGSSYTDDQGATLLMEADSDDPLTEARSAYLPLWLVAGYGVNRLLPEPDTTPPVNIPDLDRLSTLFDGRNLTSIGFADQFDADGARLFSRVLKRALTQEDSLVPDLMDLELRGPGGGKSSSILLNKHRFKMKMGKKGYKLPAVWLSQGYQSTIGWLADLIGHILKESSMSRIEPADFEGIVLIDEIDLHLHPTWQKGIVRALRETFPGLQFIATTHSPMVLPGLEPDEIISLEAREEDGRIVATAPGHPTKLRTGSDLYSDFFHIEGLEPADLAKDASDYRFLAANPFRSDSDEARLQVLKEKLTAAGLTPFPAVQRRARGGP